MLMLLLRRIRFANLNCTKQWTRRKVPCALPDSNPHSDTALQGALFQGGYLMYGITVQKNENVPETFRKRSGNVPGTFRERSRNRDNCTLAITVRGLASMIMGGFATRSGDLWGNQRRARRDSFEERAGRNLGHASSGALLLARTRRIFPQRRTRTTKLAGVCGTYKSRCVCWLVLETKTKTTPGLGSWKPTTTPVSVCAVVDHRFNRNLTKTSADFCADFGRTHETSILG